MFERFFLTYHVIAMTLFCAAVVWLAEHGRPGGGTACVVMLALALIGDHIRGEK